MNSYPHDQTHNKVEQGDEQPCHGIAFHKFGSAVQRPEKCGFGLFCFLRARARRDQSQRKAYRCRWQAASQHAVQRKACGLRHPAAPFVMTMKLTMSNTPKTTKPINTEPPMMKLANPSIDARCIRAVFLSNNKLGGGNITDKLQHQGCEQNGRE